ncbi:Hybrid signal transduction histidine kinase K [Lachnellula arida]|uniref:histidine kinase n=1 Tax=Lachnellula arida TaxID=1316785 RepID=A0A8T9BHL4_9HELO|nr:Hybrid signal transduction histidine kinase K [Lachnellula arida]
MDGSVALGDDHLDPPARLYERLRQIPGYEWDEDLEPFHSSFDNWQVFGTKIQSQTQHPNHHTHEQRSHSRSRPSSKRSSLPPLKPGSRILNVSESDSDTGDERFLRERSPIVARVSIHALREERTYHICKNLIKSVDPEGDHIVRPLDITRLASQQGDKGPIVVCIFENPGRNYLPRVIDYGPAWYTGRKVGDAFEAFRDEFVPTEKVPLQTFLDFAIGATECLEILHHGQRIVHGEIRGDAFHMNLETGKVKLINFGSGLRTFEHGLTSTGWSTLSREVGAKNKLSFMSPEQTGRMPAEPDSRTDIYSLGILFWTMLTQQAAFEGDTPMDIIQGVLGRRLPTVSSIRIDVPDVIGKIIQKMTAKSIGDRYHSASGLRHDLVEVRTLLGAGNSAALRHWQIATKDVSSFFILPTVMIGRSDEHDEVVKVIDKVSRRHIVGQKQDVTSISSESSLSQERLDGLDSANTGILETSSEDGISSAENRSNSLGRSNSLSTGGFSGEQRDHRSGSSQLRAPSFTENLGLSSDHQSLSGSSQLRPTSSAENVEFSGRSSAMPKPWEKNNSLTMDSRSTRDSMNSEAGVGGGTRSSSDSVGSLANKYNTQKFRRKGRCEVVGISGAAGLGKSCLVHSVQVEARRRGYFASSKFDRAKKTPFGPVLKLLSSLFKQVFSESNTDTPFHQILKQYVRPAWPMLHKVLGLPEFLIGALPTAAGSKSHHASKSTNSSSIAKEYNRSLRSELKNSELSSSRSHGSRYNKTLGTQNSQDFLRAGSSTKSMRLMNTFLDVLRVFTQHKFICVCLDDLQFADDESLDLITQIVAARMKMVILVTYRPDEILPEKIKGIIEPPNTEGISIDAHFIPVLVSADFSTEYIKTGGVGITRITLKPLTEDDIVTFVAATLCRPKEDVIPLAAVIQSKTAGNPFYMREMLDTCHRKQCIWYDYKQSTWCFSLDKIFKQFQTENYHETLNNDFVTSRLNELPPASRAILAWASILGASFSFELIQRLLSGEFDFKEMGIVSPEDFKPYSLTYSQEEAVGGLQATIQAYIIVATNEDDRFRFAHDRYSQAALSLAECNASRMHFIIAQTLLKYYSSQERSRDDTAMHVAKSVDIINERVLHRQSFRKLLFDVAQSAAESGARSTAASLYASCFTLLQNDPWREGAPDVYYDETLQLYVRAAECYLYLGRYSEAKRLLATVFEKARTPVDKAPAWVLQSRVFSQEGDSPAAFQALKQCLLALNITVDDEPSFEKCDLEFERLSLKIQSMDPETIVTKAMAKDSNIAAVGAVLVETTSAAYWTDNLIFYQMALVMVNTQLTYGNFPQAGMGYLHFASIAITRFTMIKFAADMGKISLELMNRWRDPYTMGRGGTIYSLFVGHIHTNLQHSLRQLEGALEYAIQAGDRISTILNFGLVANLKFFASENMVDLENFIQYGCEEIQNWQFDPRGGTMAIAVRQACRAMQGKTVTHNALEIMNDEAHSSLNYKSWLKATLRSDERSLFFYEGIEMIPLVLYGHYPRAIEMGDALLKNVDLVWSAMNTRQVMLLHGLALCGLMWSKLDHPLRALKGDPSTQVRTSTAVDHQPSEVDLAKETVSVVKQVKYLKKKIEDWQTVNDVNYLAWSTLLAAQIAELEDDHGKALAYYEKSLDHASSNGFIFEEALGNLLFAGFFLRAGSRRAAKASLREAVQSFRQIGAIGVVKHIEDEHSLLLQGPTQNMRTAEASCQTDFAGDSAPVRYRTLEGDEDDERQQSRATIIESKGDRIGAWQGGSARPDAGSGLPALDMLDLTSILESSQVISSVLQVDQLLKTMCEIILQNCGGLATSAAIVVEEDDPTPGWSIAASGDPERGAKAHIPGLPLSETPLVAEGVILYCTRFRETVFLSDILHDERFSNVTEAWSARNPVGKSIIAIPIVHGDKPLLGVLYLEGEVNAFTDRNLTVLQLLVNQIGISYSNALTLKEVKKVSAFNTSMVDMQKKALKKAQEAEVKAKKAEAEALASVKLAEEAAKAKSIFLANVSHELRTPLNGVIGNSELLRDCNLSKEQSELADSIRVSADLLLTVINDILDFSRMEADKMELCTESFKPDEMIREIVRSVSYSYRDKKRLKNIEILQDVNLPDLLIYGDPVRLHQVLGNLIGNSMKFTEMGSITVGARCDKLTKESATLTFWVKDTGIGIPSQQLVKLFKPFSQADASTARKYGGSGLGLSICKSLIESMMGGRIHLESVENQGTTAWFTVTFKKIDESTPKTPTLHNGVKQRRDPMAKFSPTVQSTAAYSDYSHIPREELRVCVAEDNRINQKIAIQFLQKLGYKHVHAYDNGLEAVEGLRKKAKENEPYHIILMDVQMPVLDGYEATKLLRRDPVEVVRSILVIAMTASAIQGDREKCLEAGMNDYLAKPVRVGVLQNKLDQYLKQAHVEIPNLHAAARQVANSVLNGSEPQPPPAPMGGLEGVSTDLAMQLRRHGALNDDEELSPETRSGNVSVTENEGLREVARDSSVIKRDPKKK